MDKDKHIIKSGTMMQGICIQWFIDTYGLSDSKTFQLYSAIVRKTFGYRQKYNYINQEYFEMSPNTLKKHRDKLVSMGLLEWKKTKRMTYYRILEPYKEIEFFQFVNKIKNEEPPNEHKKIIDIL